MVNLTTEQFKFTNNDIKAFSILEFLLELNERVREKFKKLEKISPDMNAGNKNTKKTKVITLAYTQLKNTYREKN